jgi:uncharacterized membrane protein YfcA
MTAALAAVRRLGSHPIAAAAGVGLLAGFLSGLFGIGGGLLIVPSLVLVLGMEQRLAHGTSLAAVLPIAVSGVIGFAVEGSVDWPVAAVITVGSMAGAVIGTHALHVLPVRVLGYAFAALLLISAARLLVGDSDTGGRADLSVPTVLLLVGIGLLSGTIAGLLGVGGGVVMIPAMIIIVGLPAVDAKGTSLAVIVPTSIVATERNLRRDNADLKTAAAVGLAGIVSAYFATRISVGLDEQLSNQLFAALIVMVAVRMIITTRRAEPDVERDLEID